LSKNGFDSEISKSNTGNGRTTRVRAKDTVVTKDFICKLRSFKQSLDVERG